jgi:hypothetical protein
MDLKAYYRKIKGVADSIEEEFPIVRSLAREDGGKAGRLVEVSRALAARMVADGVAELAGAEESTSFRAQVEQARMKEEQRRRAAEIQFTILSEADLRALQGAARRGRKEE